MIAAEGEQKASRALREAANVIAESSSALQVRLARNLTLTDSGSSRLLEIANIENRSVDPYWSTGTAILILSCAPSAHNHHHITLQTNSESLFLSLFAASLPSDAEQHRGGAQLDHHLPHAHEHHGPLHEELTISVIGQKEEKECALMHLNRDVARNVAGSLSAHPILKVEHPNLNSSQGRENRKLEFRFGGQIILTLQNIGQVPL